ncbi:MAG: signal recognition particle-docking protein FtsY [Nitrospirae bacterium]|nr:signal recognition particle-docking protein FtsY [Nitrospirota bacterium]
MGLIEGWSKVRRAIVAKFSALADGVAKRDPKVLAELEEFLITSDFGPEVSKRLVEEARKLLGAGESTDVQTVKGRLAVVLLETLKIPSTGAVVGPKPRVIFLVGPHGVGKTTTAGRLAHRFASEGKSVVLAAGDTHRAAAIEQVRQWAGRSASTQGRVECVGQQEGADPAAVIFDAVTHARKSASDFVIADTAGRVHTRQPLMESLQKTRRAMEKAHPGSPHETLLVLDATVGQNALSIARSFAQAVPLTGLVLTKMDGTAKGGTVFALCRELRIPVVYVGVGEGAGDLVPFEAGSFVGSLLD